MTYPVILYTTPCAATSISYPICRLPVSAKLVSGLYLKLARNEHHLIFSDPEKNNTVKVIELESTIDMGGQHQSPSQLVSRNVRTVLNDVILNKLQSRDYSNNIDFARYKIDWLCTLLLRIGGTLDPGLEDSTFWGIS